MAMNTGGQGPGFFGSQGMITDINITPFVDVMLVLLIIFMVTSPLAVSGVDVQLPKNQAKALSLNEDPLILSVSASGDYFLGKTSVSEKDLAVKLNAIKKGANSSIFIRADKNVPYGRVANAMAAAQFAGIRRIGMMGENDGSTAK